MNSAHKRQTAFIEAAIWHGTLEKAEALLAANPEIATASIHTAAILGDATTVRKYLAIDPTNAAAKADPFGGDALVYLCLSKYLRLDATRTSGFLSAATALLDAGADPNTGFWTTGSFPEFETALYGAAGVAHHAELTQLLLDRSADPNDEEVAYHSPETYNNATLHVLGTSGKLTADSLATMLLRKADWHDTEGIKYLLEHGADPNRMTRWHHTALLQALRRDNGLEIIEMFLDKGADPKIANPLDGKAAGSIAARRGRGDVLEAFERRGIGTSFQGVERLIAACARNDAAAIRAIAEKEPELVANLLADGGTLLAEFAGNANSEGVARLLDLGVPVTALYKQGDGYFGTAPDSTALHVAAWRAWHGTVNLLIKRGATIDALDSAGRTPLALAVRACVDSYWKYRRAPDSVRALLQAGASVNGVAYPSGYAEVDELLRSAGSK